jgi:hypothetical protein
MTKKVYKNTTIYKRCTHSEEHPFTMVSNYLIRELQAEDPKRRIDFTELGFMVYLLSNSDNFIFNSEYTQKKISGIGQDKYYQTVKHLQKLGYLKKTRKEGGINWIISEILFHIPENKNTIENTSSDNTSIENTNSGSTSIENTNSVSRGITNTNTKTQIEEVRIEEVKKESIKNKSVIADSALESVSGQSLASASLLAPSTNIPNAEVEKAVPYTTNPTVEKKTLPITIDARFEQQEKEYHTSKYFQQNYLFTVRQIYSAYAKNNPKRFMKIMDFEKVLACIIKLNIPMAKRMDLSHCLIYRDDIISQLKHIHQFIKDMKDDPEYFKKLLSELELPKNN